ncbi:condensin subunit YCS4 [Sporobolomyces salmoneus]|uniref:condensin subunit YCS4 n=1 Tax=Sporobolomyces salmoneus TaxID=183962 RepID=UPI00317A8FEB
MEFNLSEELILLSQYSSNLSEYPVELPGNGDLLDQHEQTTTLNDLVDTLANDSNEIRNQSTFDTIRCFIKIADQLPGPTLSKLLDSLLSAFSSEIDQTRQSENPSDHASYRAHKPALEAYSFLISWFVTVGEKLSHSQNAASQAGGELTATGRKKAPPKGKKKATSSGSKDEFNWIESIPMVLEVLVKMLRTIRTERIWQTTAERDELISNCFLKPTNLLAESEQYLKLVNIKSGIFRVLCLAAKNHGQSFNVQMTIMQNLQYNEHLSEPMAELVTVYSKEFDNNILGEKVLGEIADRHFSSQDTKGPRSFSKFLIRLCEISPRLVLKQIVLLQKHLDSESYPMRNSILEILSLLIKELSLSDPATLDSLGMDEVKIKRELETFFGLLFERLLDLNSYVRSKVANLLIKTCDLPVQFPSLRLELTHLTIRSLHDKSSSVRKNCLALLTKLVLTHPYGRMHGGELELSVWQKRLDELEQELKVLDLPDEGEREARRLMDGDGDDEEKEEEKGEEDQEMEEEAEEEGEEESSDEEGTPKKRKPLKNKNLEALKQEKKGPRRSELDLAAQSQNNILATVDSDTLQRLRLTKKYYTDAISFIEAIEESMDTVTELLASSVKSEVLEAMEFCKTAKEYKIEAAEQGVRRMLHLIWSKDEAAPSASATTGGEDGEDGQKEVKGIRSRLIECYSSLYFEPPEDIPRKDQIAFVARNVIELTRDATLAELTSLEALLAVMMSRGVVDDEVINKLWQVYSTSKEIPRFQRRGSIITLGMFAQPKPEVVADHVETLLKIGLGSLGRADLVLAKYTCIALGRVAGSVKKVKGSLKDVSVRLPMESPVFSRLADTIQAPSKSKEWFSMAEQAVNTIYTLGDQPDALCSEILRKMTTRVFGPRASPAKGKEVEKGDEEKGDDEEADKMDEENQEVEQPEEEIDQGEGDATPQAEPTVGNAFELSQLIFVAGHCAIKQLVHLELVERDLKRRKAEDDKAKGGKKSGDDELDQVAGSVEDEIGDTIAIAREKELMYGPQSLLQVFGPMSASIVSQPKVYRNPMLKTAATLALSKFMCVSSEFCAEHLMLLFKVLETSREPAVRSNIVIALGDIAVCFSTIMDENSDRLYAGLHDKDLTVKKNTLMVLTHLILNGMIKVKGQLGEMAKCLSDDDKRIKDLAHLFFEELATKDKAIYNNLPDIISHLSSGEMPVAEDTFQTSMRFIFKFVDKKKEAESIVEKLCQRFTSTTEARQWRDIAFCLSLLPFNSDAAVKKLTEGLPFYQDKLHEETVYKRFGEILTKIRAPTNKLSKTDGELKEFEDALERYRAKGTEDQEMQRKVQKSRKKGGAKAAAPTRRNARRKAQSTPPSSPER